MTLSPWALRALVNFDLLVAPFNDQLLFDCIDRTLKLIGGVSASPTWALSNHDTPRLVSRIGAEEARAMALFTFGLPGSCYVFQGQELGLPDAELNDHDRQDPAFFRTNGTQKGRDGARVPLPWNGSQTPFGFTAGRPWLPIPQEWIDLSVAAETGDISSSLEMYRTALALRKDFLRDENDFQWTQTPDRSGIISYRRGKIEIFLNTSDSPRTLSTMGEHLISSCAIERHNGEIVLNAHACVWVHTLNPPKFVSRNLLS